MYKSLEVKEYLVQAKEGGSFSYGGSTYQNSLQRWIGWSLA